MKLMLNNFNIIDQIYSGSNSIIFKAETDSTEFVALKLISNEELAQNEIRALTECQHQHILKVYDIFTYEDYIVIVSEFCQRGDLVDFIQALGPVEEKLAISICYKILSGISFMHNKGIAHLDIKPDNILLTDDLEPKICDFGYARKISELPQIFKYGTNMYTPPEFYTRGKLDGAKADVWNVGVIFYCLLTASFPWDEESIFMGDLSESECLCYLPNRIQNVIKRLLSKSVNERPTAEEALNHLEECFYSEYHQHLKQ
jgi:serine/threonine protein kinase